MNDAAHRAMVYIAATGGIVWLLFLAAALWALVHPVTLPTVEQPVKVLNQDKTVAVGEPVLLKLVVDKPEDLDSVGSDRFIVCDDAGIIATIGPSVRQLPVGQYTIVSDTIRVPGTVPVGQECYVRFVTEFRINPLRLERTVFESELFTVQRGRWWNHFTDRSY